MNKVFEKAINRVFRSDLEFVFGKGSHVVVSDFSYSTSMKNFNCLITLYVVKINDEVLSFYPEALELFVLDTYKLFSLTDKIIIITSIKEINGTSNSTL